MEDEKYNIEVEDDLLYDADNDNVISDNGDWIYHLYQVLKRHFEDLD